MRNTLSPIVAANDDIQGILYLAYQAADGYGMHRERVCAACVTVSYNLNFLA